MFILHNGLVLTDTDFTSSASEFVEVLYMYSIRYCFIQVLDKRLIVLFYGESIFLTEYY